MPFLPLERRIWSSRTFIHGFRYTSRLDSVVIVRPAGASAGFIRSPSNRSVAQSLLDGKSVAQGAPFSSRRGQTQILQACNQPTTDSVAGKAASFSAGAKPAQPTDERGRAGNVEPDKIA